ncbi:MAG: sulfatase-like hydrolase/transferase [Williamsia sp.]|nr:sulfatase-like hydrolase/transferase [Williamsia sp.]
MKVFRTRYAVLGAFVAFFVFSSFLIRTLFIVLSWKKMDLSVLALAAVYAKGFVFDLAVSLYFTVLYSLYLLFLPQKWNNQAFNRIFTYTGSFLAVLLSAFSFFAEVPFWHEFESRYNFIAVDYLMYTYEVVNNINQTYPLPYLIGSMVLISLLTMLFFRKQKIFTASFYSVTPFKQRLAATACIFMAVTASWLLLSNDWAETGRNRYNNELAKSGPFSFFAAFKNNELDYNAFYLKENEGLAFRTVRNELAEQNARFQNTPFSISRLIANHDQAQKPNVIMVTIESFSAGFMGYFGNPKNITPVLDSVAKESMVFTDMYATGTRTVRGMEALTLAIPPTPGNSVVRRKDNKDLFNIGTVFGEAGYSRTFFYGGDGYFDNMNLFFGNNGFNIVDRGRKIVPNEHLYTTRTTIPDQNVQFENAWGVCDEDLYDAVIREADKQQSQDQPFFDFVMTTSNHTPYTYPKGKIDIAPGTGREGAVKYTDYAIGEFLKKIQKKEWFKNTVIIFVADHCASSAGRDEVDVAKYHIPCIVYNLPVTHPSAIDVQCSQIDLYPTLFGLLNWKYQSNFYGCNVLLPGYHPRAFVGTYQKLGYLQQDSLVILSPQQQATTTLWNKAKDEQTTIKQDAGLIKKAVAFYQTAYYLYKNGRMKAPYLEKDSLSLANANKTRH